MYRDWICIVPLYPGFMASLPKPNESGHRKEHSVREWVSRSHDAVFAFTISGKVIETNEHGRLQRAVVHL